MRFIAFVMGRLLIEISQTSHLEKDWIENKDNRSAISYQDAFALNYE